ncbi:YwmB family TATA-box binding protein [Bacillus solimangrovi]|uniref:YwmB family TATA-box binding protein n=1 Tax=Bacillus solimangrovi TaxID=1305675 RepID=A0A1E5LGX6_9BACI|nr:YwmB family TATA-box binding protein [Bacillus solimangrovi]OEH93330.1 hypothetical protein BFG57_12460 [Bacillus solimangrovi]
MKYYRGIMLFILCMFTLLFINHTGETKGNDYDLERLVVAFQNQDISIENWNMYAREEKVRLETYDEFEAEVKRLAKKVEDFTWSFEREEHMWKAIAVKHDQKLNITEKILLTAYPTKKNHQTYLIYDIEGEKWDHGQWSHVSDRIVDSSSKIFQKTPQFYSCVSGHAGDMMKGVLQTFSDNVLEELGAQPVSRLIEDNFISISAYSKQFSQEIALYDQDKMNLQVGIRQQGMGGVTTVTIGTPIITLEY